MQGQVTVLVVSVDADPTGLNNELTQLGVTVLSSALHDCEELIEEKKPDLVVLLGARGAMELASLIEGHDGPSSPRMVIAADRRELAKMIGLNRDVVVSLFATESGEKVLGQRIESLARRAARRRTASIPPISLKGTSLGLPSVSRAPSKFSSEALGKISLKAGPAARPTAASNDEAPPPPSLFVPDPVAPETVKLAASRRSGAGEGEPIKVAKKTAPAALPASVARPPIASAALPATQLAVPAVVAVAVEETDLLSLRPSEFPDADIESVPPLDLDEPASPPTLPPAAKRESLPEGPAPPVGELVPGTDPPLSDFDVSGAEAALENLENLLVSASKPAALSAVEPPSTQEQPGVAKSVAVEEDDVPSAGPSVDGPTTDVLSRTASPDAAIESDLDAEEQFFSSAPAPALEEAPAVQPPSDSGGKSRGVSVWIPAALVAAAVGGAVYVHRSQVSVSGEGKQHVAVVAPPASAPSLPSAVPTVGSEAVPASDAAPALASTPEAAPSASAAAPAATASGEPASSAAEAPAIPSAEAAPSDVSKDPAPQPSSAALVAEAEPFVVTDTRRPTCAAIVGEDVPRPGRDIVHEASTLWAEARKMIVAGRLDDAHKKMCQAVAVNPESAAVEGLAGFYVDQFSLDEAEIWINKAQEIRPGQRETLLLLGDVQGLRGNTAQARTTWLSALKIPETKTGQIRAMSRDYSTAAGRKLVSGDLAKAELWYRRAVVLDEQNLAALMGLANTFMRKDKPKHALAFAYKVLSISELIPEMQVLVGNVAAKAGDQAEARRRYEKALTIRSDFFPAKRGLSELE